MWSTWNSHSWLVGMKNGNSLTFAVFYKISIKLYTCLWYGTKFYFQVISQEKWKKKNAHTKMCTQIFITAWCRIGKKKNWKWSKCPPATEWETLVYPPNATLIKNKKKWIPICSTTPLNFKSIMQSERSQSQKAIGHMTP